MSGRDYLTIGEVVDRLESLYPDLSVSKIRFLEEEGLIEPERTSGGYRKFSDRDVSRLEAVLRMQKTNFYPLSVIKTKLDDLDRGEVPPELKGAQFASDALIDSDKEHPLEIVPELLDVDISLVRKLSEFGLLKITKGTDGRETVSGRDVPLIQAAGALAAYGIEPRHLRIYLNAADRESLMFKQIIQSVSGRIKRADDSESRRKLRETLSDLETQTGRIRICLLHRALADDLDGII